MNSLSPMYEAIRQVVERWHLSREDVECIYRAITDHVFYQELGYRLGTDHPIPLPLYEPKWEYFVKDLYIEAPEGQIHILNHYGQQGWELVNVNSQFAYFKRLKNA